VPRAALERGLGTLWTLPTRAMAYGSAGSGPRNYQYGVVPALVAIPEDDDENSRSLRHMASLVSPLHESLTSAVRVQVSGTDLYGRRIRRNDSIFRGLGCGRHAACCALVAVCSAVLVFMMWFYLFRNSKRGAWV